MSIDSGTIVAVLCTYYAELYVGIRVTLADCPQPKVSVFAANWNKSGANTCMQCYRPGSTVL